MSITPIDIQQYRFKNRLFGYDPVSVDRFLEMVADELEKLHRSNQELKEELSRSRSALEEMRQRETMLKDTLLTAQKVSDDIKANARSESDIILTDAELKAERIVRDAEERRIQLINEIQELKRRKISFETSLRTLVESHLRMLDLDVVQLAQHSRDDRLLEEFLPFDEEATPVLDPEEDPDRD